jgi:hypothetical protein
VLHLPSLPLSLSTLMMASALSTTTVTSQRSHSADSTQPSRQQEHVGPQDGKDDHDRFFWTYTEEPHKTRRQAIIKAHPEVRMLSLEIRPNVRRLICTRS